MPAVCAARETHGGTGPILPAEQDLARLLAVSELHPLDQAMHRTLAAAYRAAGQEIEARVEEAAATALERGAPLAVFNLGTAYFSTGYYDLAARWYRVAIAMAPGLSIAHQNLARILFDWGQRDAARHHRDIAFRDQCVFVAPALQERRRVLVLAAAGYGNIPLQHILPQHVNTEIAWFVEYAKPDTAASLPAFDLVLNAVGDPDLDGPTYDTSCAFLARCTRPVLNHPAAVARTRRDRLPDLLGGIDGVEVPAVLRVPPADDAARAHGLGFPLLVRPAASHGGEGLVRVEHREQLRTVDWDGAEAWYLTTFRDYRSADGQWRKYRMIFVEGEPHAYHLAISAGWLVHYATAGMPDDRAKCEEERRFLADPEQVLGTAAMRAIREVGRRLGLDYAGIDFALLPDGRVLVFEANATMLVHPETDPRLAYKNPFVTHILGAVEAMLAGRLAAWPVAA